MEQEDDDFPPPAPPTFTESELPVLTESQPGTASRGEIKGISHEEFSDVAAAVAAQPELPSSLAVLTSNPTYTFSTVQPAGAYPSDSNVAASKSHVCLTFRRAFACYTKSGTPVSVGLGFAPGMVESPAFFTTSGITPQLTTDYTHHTADLAKDGRVIFDPFHQRFFMVFQSREGPCRLLIAVSKSQDPRDGWWTYADQTCPGTDTQDYDFLG